MFVTRDVLSSVEEEVKFHRDIEQFSTALNRLQTQSHQLIFTNLQANLMHKPQAIISVT